MYLKYVSGAVGGLNAERDVFNLQQNASGLSKHCSLCVPGYFHQLRSVFDSFLAQAPEMSPTQSLLVLCKNRCPDWYSLSFMAIALTEKETGKGVGSA